MQDPITLHKYLYANGNPVSYKDPSGNLAVGGGFLAPTIQMSMVTMAQPLFSGVVLRRVALAVATSVTGAYFAGDKATKKYLEECIQSTKTGKNDCRPATNIFIVGDDNDEVRDHIAEAQLQGQPSMLSRRDPPHSRGWLKSQKGFGKRCSNASGTQCDEYPFASSIEGGKSNNVSLKSVNGSQNESAGAHLGWFYQKCQVPANVSSEKFRVLPVKGIEVTGYVYKK